MAFTGLTNTQGPSPQRKDLVNVSPTYVQVQRNISSFKFFQIVLFFLTIFVVCPKFNFLPLSLSLSLSISLSLSLSADWGKYFDHQVKPLTPIQASKSIPRTRWANAQPLSRHYHFLQQQHHHHLEGPQVSCESSRHETDFKYLGANKGLSEQNGVSERSKLTPFWER